jgi:hypothetical protein
MVKLSRLKSKLRRRTRKALEYLSTNAIILFFIKVLGILVSIISVIVLIIVNWPIN